MMQKGKRVHQQQATKITMRKNQSPKKHQQLQQQTNQIQIHPNHQKKIKINALNLNQLNTSINDKQSRYQNQQKKQRFQLQNNSDKKRAEEDSSRIKNSPYYEVYKSDLKYYGEYLESCQKITHNGINYKWPYCFYNGS